jgi:ATP/maltotriose-dependent transcriptional regulator MalT
VHILIQTEKPPPLPLGRLRVRRQLVELMEE